MSAECKLGAYGLVSLTRSVSPASTRLDLAPRLCYALRRWPGSDACPRRAATCTTARGSVSLVELRQPRSRPATPTSSPLRSPSSSSAGHGRAPPPPAAPPAAVVPRPLPALRASPRCGPSARLVHVLVGIAEMDPAAGAPPCRPSTPRAPRLRAAKRALPPRLRTATVAAAPCLISCRRGRRAVPCPPRRALTTLAATPCCALLGRPWRPAARRGRRAACVAALPPHYLSLKDAKVEDNKT